jgi:hypothetical protein
MQTRCRTSHAMICARRWVRRPRRRWKHSTPRQRCLGRRRQRQTAQALLTRAPQASPVSGACLPSCRSPRCSRHPWCHLLIDFSPNLAGRLRAHVRADAGPDCCAWQQNVSFPAQELPALPGPLGADSGARSRVSAVHKHARLRAHLDEQGRFGVARERREHLAATAAARLCCRRRLPRRR